MNLIFDYGMIPVSARFHWVIIKVHKKLGHQDLIEILKWENLRWDLRQKYSWYFNYRTALLQIKYPKYYVEMSWGNIEADTRTKKELLAQQISSKKAQVTKWKNQILSFEKSWNSLFSINTDSNYQKARAKLFIKEQELLELTNIYDKL